MFLWDTMARRVFVILLGGVIVSAAITFALLAEDRSRSITKEFRAHVVERLAQFVSLLEAVPPGNRPSVAQAATTAGVSADFPPAIEHAGEEDDEFRAALVERVGAASAPHAFVLEGGECREPPDDDFLPHFTPLCLATYFRLQDGTLVRVVVKPRRGGHYAKLQRPPPEPRTEAGVADVPPPQPGAGPEGAPPGPPPDGPFRGEGSPRHGHPHDPFAGAGHLRYYFVLFAVFVGLLAYGVARMTVRPLRRLAQAAVEFGRDIERPPLPERGPAEVRRAAAAFNLMQARIRRHIQERTYMLAAITHDLQTPLTRLRLRLEKVQDPDLQARLIGDLAAMQSTIREGLDLAQSMDSKETLQAIDLEAMVSSVVEDAQDMGCDAALEQPLDITVRARPNALRRCLTNLVDNAVKYGKSARVRMTRNGGEVLISIRDRGPGIPEQELEAVFKPFHRLESSRSRETGGTGLGLTIARNIAESNYGSLVLRNHPEGGIEALLTLQVLAG